LQGFLLFVGFYAFIIAFEPIFIYNFCELSYILLGGILTSNGGVFWGSECCGVLLVRTSSLVCGSSHCLH